MKMDMKFLNNLGKGLVKTVREVGGVTAMVGIIIIGAKLGNSAYEHISPDETKAKS